MALNGHAVIRAATRERVARVAAEMGYRKDGAASLLAGRVKEAPGGRKQIGMAFLRSPGQLHLDSAYARFRQQAEKFGYHAESIDLRTYSSQKRAAEHLFFLNMKGLFIASPGALPSRDWLSFPWDQFAAVKAGRTWPELDLPLIRHSAFDYMRASLEAVRSHGLRRCAVLLSESTSLSDDDARLGAVLAFEARYRSEGVTVDYRRVSEDKHTDASKRHAEVARLVRWLRKSRPEVLVAFPGSWYFELTQAGLKIPEQVGFAAVLEDEDIAYDFGVSGCLSRRDCLEEEAVRMLDRLLRMGRTGPGDGNFHVVLEPIWHEGRTLPKVVVRAGT